MYGIAPSAIPLDTGSSSSVWVVDGRLADHAARRLNHKGKWRRGLEVFDEHLRTSLQSYTDGDPAALDLGPLQPNTQEVRSPSRTSYLGQPHTPTIWFSPRYL